MSLSTRRRRVGSASVAALGLSAFVASATLLVWRTDAVTAVSTPVVAIVNGSAITAEDLDLRFSQVLPLSSYHGRLAPEQILSLKRAALDELVLDELIYREAAAAGRRPSPESVKAEVDAVRARFESAETFSAALAESGLDEAAFRQRLARAVIVRESRDDHSRVTVDDGDIATYYRENAARFQRPEQVRLRQILFRVDPADPATAAPAETKARSALARLLGGEPFGALARRLSEDEYRVKDGDMGLVHRGRLDREFEDAVFAAPVGRPRLAHSLYGFEVFEVLDRQPPAQLTLEQARPVIAERLAHERRAERLRVWKSRLLAASSVEIRDVALGRTRPADLPDTGVAAGIRSGRRPDGGAAR